MCVVTDYWNQTWYRYDVIAQLYYARKLAEKLYPSSKMVELHGGHLVSHERPKEVCINPKFGV